RIDVLAEMSRNNPGLSVFASNVRQVEFNAWDYSDDELWSGLVDHLFGALAADPGSPSALPDPSTVEAERRRLRGNLAEQEAAVVAPTLVIGQRLRSWHRAGTGATARLRQRLDQQERAVNQKIADLKERLALIDAGARLSAFISDRAAPAAYQKYRGLLGQVR